jgi:hypothetical protein
MTAGPQEERLAAEALDAGMAANAEHLLFGESLLYTTGAGVVIEQPSIPAVTWTGSSAVPDPGLPLPPKTTDLTDS